jgi:hypothetical protein
MSKPADAPEIVEPEWEKTYPEPWPEGKDDEFWIAIIKPGDNKNKPK